MLIFKRFPYILTDLVSYILSSIEGKMQAPDLQSSRIKINFGKSHSGPSPIDISLTLDVFSPQQQTMKDYINACYKVELPITCFALQFIATKQTAKETAERLKMHYEEYILTYPTPNRYSFYHHEDKVMCLFEVEVMDHFMEENEHYFQELKTNTEEDRHQIKLRITSLNNCEAIWQKSQIQGQMAWLNSMHLQFQFVKTDRLTKFMTILLTNVFDIESVGSMLHSFKRVNLQLNFQNSSHLANYPKVKKIMPNNDLNTTRRSSFWYLMLKGNIENGRIFMFNSSFYVRGEVNISALPFYLSKLTL